MAGREWQRMKPWTPATNRIALQMKAEELDVRDSGAGSCFRN